MLEADLNHDTREIDFMVVNGRTLDAGEYEQLPFCLCDYADADGHGCVQVRFHSYEGMSGGTCMEFDVIDVETVEGTKVLPTELQTAIWRYMEPRIREMG